MARYLLYLFVTMFIVFGCAWIWVLEKPMSFLNKDYPILEAKIHLATNLPAGSVVIFGDSRPLVSLMPDRIGPDVYNLAIGGGSPIEVWALARIALSAPHPPRAAILSLAPVRLMTSGTLWDQGIKFGLLDRTTVGEIRIRARQYPDDLVFQSVDRLDPSVRGPLFGPETAGDIEARLKINLFALRFPSYYYASLMAGGFYQREAENRATYREVQESRGHKILWNADGSHDLSPETTGSSFVPSPLLDSYFSDTIDLFQKRNIPVYFVACPFSDESIAALQPGFAEEFDDYLKSYEKRYPNFHRLGPTMPALPWIDFGGKGHLNIKGAKLFSDEVAARLRDAGIEK